MSKYVPKEVNNHCMYLDAFYVCEKCLHCAVLSNLT